MIVCARSARHAASGLDEAHTIKHTRLAGADQVQTITDPPDQNPAPLPSRRVDAAMPVAAQLAGNLGKGKQPVGLSRSGAAGAAGAAERRRGARSVAWVPLTSNALIVCNGPRHSDTSA
jgi:hypothetical protein